MDTEFVGNIILCDGFIVEKLTEKITLIGCFSALGSPQIPFVHPGITVFLQLTNFRTPEINLDIAVRLEDRTGHVLASAAAHVEAKILAPATDITASTIDLPLRLPPVVFQSAGTYAIIALAKKEEVARKMLPIFVPEAPPLQT